MQDQANIRSRGWVFTLNNPAISIDDYMVIPQAYVKYWVAGDEIGEQGTRHFQGYIFYNNAQRFSTVKSHLPRAHIEKQRGSITQAIEYCKKDGLWKEWGTIPTENNPNRGIEWNTIIQKAQDGELDYIKCQYPQIYLRYHAKLKELFKPTTVILSNLENEWWYGPTGTGKSKKIWEDYPEHYQKKKNKWWDAYNREDVVVIEEWSPDNSILASSLKIWSDRYPFPAEIKGGMMQKIRPKKIIVTSNYSMEQCFPREEDLAPMKRRFKQLHFPTSIFNYNLANEIINHDEANMEFINSILNL